MLAGTEKVVARFLGSVLQRRETAALVAAVAEWLVLAHPAGAPPVVLAHLQRHLDGRLGRDDRLGHVCFPLCGGFVTVPRPSVVHGSLGNGPLARKRAGSMLHDRFLMTESKKPLTILLASPRGFCA